jgi:hypothetical protein
MRTSHARQRSIVGKLGHQFFPTSFANIRFDLYIDQIIASRNRCKVYQQIVSFRVDSGLS